MTNNIETYKNEIIKHQNELIKNYCQLMVIYEESRQLYEKLIKEYEMYDVNEDEIVDCSQIIIYHDCSVIVKWGLYKLDGTQVYTSGNNIKFDVWKFNLANITGLEVGTVLRLKALSEGKDSYAPVYLRYEPASYGSIYFEFHGKLISSHSELLDVVYSSYPNTGLYQNAILPCGAVLARNSSRTITRYQILKLDGEVIYTSDKYKNTDGDWLKSLQKLELEEGTLLRVKAADTGRDDTAEIIVQYDSTSTIVAHFHLVGNAFKNMFEYVGTVYPF